MKKVSLSIGMLVIFHLAAAELNCDVDSSGVLRITSEKTVWISHDNAQITNGRGVAISHLLVTNMTRTEKDGAVTCAWGVDIGSIRRTVKKTAADTVTVHWHFKLLNGVVLGRILELSCVSPISGCKVSFLSSPDNTAPELGLEAGRQILHIRATGNQAIKCGAAADPEQKLRIFFRQPYFADKVNEIETTLEFRLDDHR